MGKCRTGNRGDRPGLSGCVAGCYRVTSEPPRLLPGQGVLKEAGLLSLPGPPPLRPLLPLGAKSKER